MSQHPGTAGAPKLARSWYFSPQNQGAGMGGNALALRRFRCFYHYFGGESKVILVLPRCVTRGLCPQGYLTPPPPPSKGAGKRGAATGTAKLTYFGGPVHVFYNFLPR